MWTTDAIGRALLCATTLLFSTACVEQGLRDWTDTERRWEAPVADAAPALPVRHVDGAIWNGKTSSGSFFFFDQKARGEGDLVTVIVDEVVQADSRALTDTDRLTRLSASASSDLGLAELFFLPFKELAKLFGADTVDPDPGGTFNAIEAGHENVFEGEGQTQRSGRFAAVLTCRVLRVLPGNIFHIQGRRSIVVNHEEQFLTLDGYVRMEDIGINNTVPSSAVADARMTLDGVGVLDDKQRPGLIARVLDWVYPF